MPTKRTYRGRHPTAAQLADADRAFLLDLDTPPDFYISLQRREALWRTYGRWATAEDVKEYPGTRLSLWWRFESRQARLRLGGVGCAMGSPPGKYYPGNYFCGIPNLWCWDGLADMFRKISIEKGGDGSRWQRYDPADPPRYEAQGSYLRRLRLLLPGELERLTPADFADEIIPQPLPPPPPPEPPGRYVGGLRIIDGGPR